FYINTVFPFPGSISTADGSALVKLGNTTVICGVKAEFAAPPLDAPDRGYIEDNKDKSLMWIYHRCVHRGFGLDLLEKRPKQPASSLQMSLKSKTIMIKLDHCAFLCSAFTFIVFFIIKSSSQIIKKEDLCISPGKLAWVLYCDLICLDYDGNILDACTFALLAALKNGKQP
ncbi:hypothetical protein A6R68_07098, partial [Neotoma lepida]